MAQRDAGGARERTREFERLVVAALAEARAVQRHRYQQLRPVRPVDRDAFDHQGGEYAPGGEVGVELEARLEQVERMRIAERRPRRGKRWFGCEAFAAGRRGDCQRQRAARAAGMVGQQVADAAGAEVAIRRTGRAAEQAAWRQGKADEAPCDSVNRDAPVQVDSPLHGPETSRSRRSRRDEALTASVPAPRHPHFTRTRA